MSRLAVDRYRRRTAAAIRRALDAGSSRLWHPVPIMALGLIGLILLLGPIAAWVTPISGLQGKELADARNATRQTLLAAVGGLAILAGLVFTARTYYLTRRGQLTNRYATAIAQLASDKITERLGGIYALQHLIRDSDEDHETIVEILAAFIRERVPASDDVSEGVYREATLSSDPPQQRPQWAPRPPTDVRAALTVLNRRPRRAELFAINLERTDLRGAQLPGAQLEWADLHGAQLHHAWLVEANLDGANLQGAQLTAYLMGTQLRHANLQDAHMPEARLNTADLHGARLTRACMRGATLVETQLQGADLSNADFQDADLNGAQLQGANLTGVQGLTAAQLATATLDDTTQLPAGIRRRATEPPSTDPSPTPQLDETKTDENHEGVELNGVENA